MHSRNCSFVILGLTFFFTILSTIRLFSVKWSVATPFPEVPILVPTLVVLLVLIVRSLAPLSVAPLVASLVPILVASLSRQIEVMNSTLKSISRVFLALSSLFKYSCHITGALIYAKEIGKRTSRAGGTIFE